MNTTRFGTLETQIEALVREHVRELQSMAAQAVVRAFGNAPWPVVCQILILQASTSLIVLMTTRYLVLRHRSAWVVFAYPMAWVGIDALQASFTVDRAETAADVSRSSSVALVLDGLGIG